MADMTQLDFLLCQQCGHDVVRFDSVVSIPSILSYRQRNDSIHGKDKVLIQLFRNPQGSHFEVITSKDADVLKVDKAYSEDSWFPGFTWTIAVCPRCGTHLGWVFEAVENYVQSDKKSFVGLILDKLLHQNYAESLLIIPKSYKS
ncbi:protein cereblon-like isoform X2 [Liolophura sinensis]|uniref:protein cereblon-like isoform X2 n=1 Tax=Liolophura sinensis TaxID=3198878 RepID=UPI00315971A3